MPRSRTTNRPPRRSGSAQDRAIRATVLYDYFGAAPPLDEKRNVSSADEWVDSLLEKVGMQGGLEEERVIKAWKTLAGGLIASQTAPVSLRRGVLVLRVLQPTMRFQLEQEKRQLLRRLQEKLGSEHLKQLRLTVG